MKLTKTEKEICKEFSKRDKDGDVHCFECPLAMPDNEFLCYANIDGRTKLAKMLPRYMEE